MSDDQARKAIKERVYTILNTKQPSEAVIQLFQIERTLQLDHKIHIREPILLILENQHDWENIMKCLRHWKGIEKFQRGFYERMKKRLDQAPDSNLPDHELVSEISKLIYRHWAEYEKRKPLVANVEKYLRKEQPVTIPSSLNLVKSSPNLQTVQPKTLVHSMKMTNEASFKPAEVITKPVQPAESVQPPQIVQGSTSLSTDQDQESVKSKKSVLSNQSLSRKTEAPKPVEPKLPQRSTEIIDPQRSNSNSTVNSKQNPKLPAGVMKKKTFGMVYKREDNVNPDSNPINSKQPRRLTFGISDEMRNNVRLNKSKSNPEVKVSRIELYNQANKKQQAMQKNENMNSGNVQIQQAIQEVQEPQREDEEFKKSNAFERKEEASTRVNPIFVTQKKEIPQNLLLERQQSQEKSLSKSVTPHKPLIIERKKIVLKKATDLRPQHNNFDDDFDDLPMAQSDNMIDEPIFYSQKKVRNRAEQVENKEEEELRREIQISTQNKAPSETNKLNQNFRKIPSQKNLTPASKPSILQNPQQRPTKHPQSHQKKPSNNTSTMFRRQDQLYSDYEVSLMGFNPREDSDDITIDKIMKKLNFRTFERHTQELNDKIEELRRKRQARVRRYVL